jgi:hypothetical protein
MIERNPKLGYYTVGTEVFYSKPQAYIRATELGVTPGWHFNTIDLAKFNWTQEPEVSIRELYRIRAQQLRDQYDWIRVEASGGGDSTTAIFAFLLNGIHLDEVVFRYPAQVDKDVTDDPWNTNAENTLSEKKFAAEPLLHWIKTNFPDTVVTVQDYSENLLNDSYMRDESWVYTTRDWFQPGHGIKHTNFGTTAHQTLADSGKKICALYGIDKPKVCIIENKWYVYYSDLQANHPNPVVGDNTNITTELFYWTPDLPEIVCKQAHMIKMWFDMSQNGHVRHLVQTPNGNTNQRTAYEYIAKSIIYPDYDLETWQTSKPTTSFYNEMDHWFHTNLAGTEYDHAWRAGLKFLVDKIDPKYFQYELNSPVGFKPNLSQLYYIGDSTYNPVSPKFVNRGYLERSNMEIMAIQNRKLKKIATHAI